MELRIIGEQRTADQLGIWAQLVDGDTVLIESVVGFQWRDVIGRTRDEIEAIVLKEILERLPVTTEVKDAVPRLSDKAPDTTQRFTANIRGFEEALGSVFAGDLDKFNDLLREYPAASKVLSMGHFNTFWAYIDKAVETLIVTEAQRDQMKTLAPNFNIPLPEER